MGRWGDDGDGEDDGDDEPSILVSANERDIRCGRAYNGGGVRGVHRSAYSDVLPTV